MFYPPLDVTELTTIRVLTISSEEVPRPKDIFVHLQIILQELLDTVSLGLVLQCRCSEARPQKHIRSPFNIVWKRYGDRLVVEGEMFQVSLELGLRNHRFWAVRVVPRKRLDRYSDELEVRDQQFSSGHVVVQGTVEVIIVQRAHLKG